MPDLRYKEEETKPSVDTTKKTKEMPYGYTKVKLDSLGKLYAPKELHFRNFTVEELTDLAAANDSKDALKVFVRCLNNMVHENFDCKFLTEKDLEEVLMTLNIRWGKVFKNVPYLYAEKEEDLEEANTLLKENLEIQGKAFKEIKNLDSKENVGYADLPMTNLKTKELAGDVGPIFNMTTTEGESVKLKIACVGDFIEVQDYIENIYFEKERKFSDFKLQYAKYKQIEEEIRLANRERTEELINMLPKLDFTILEEYEDFLKQKESDFFKVIEASLIVSYGKKKCETLKEKVTANKKIGSHFWEKYSKIMRNNFEYGILPEVTFFSVDLGKTIERRFSFRYLDFIQKVESATDTDIEVSFSR
ncbi:MAG: hypothetical protein GF311_28235 [Candidatus Lokiarchaeota archaeon]|nr:hypothetical protein [Candidatus Lokiarchaeota archaeon]